jgi:hypothetical protein
VIVVEETVVPDSVPDDVLPAEIESPTPGAEPVCVMVVPVIETPE